MQPTPKGRRIRFHLLKGVLVHLFTRRYLTWITIVKIQRFLLSFVHINVFSQTWKWWGGQRTLSKDTETHPKGYTVTFSQAITIHKTGYAVEKWKCWDFLKDIRYWFWTTANPKKDKMSSWLTVQSASKRKPVMPDIVLQFYLRVEG